MDLWTIDPLPVPPVGLARDSMAWWRWWTALVLADRKAK
jgi:hypothetical protein